MSVSEPSPVPVATNPPGWYDDGAGTRRWWDGRGWTEHVERTPEQRAAALNAAVAGWVRGGWTIEFNDGQQAVLTRVRRIGWFFNTIMVLVTFGLWLIYVIYRALNRKVDRRVLTIDERGKLQTRYA